DGNGRQAEPNGALGEAGQREYGTDEDKRLVQHDPDPRALGHRSQCGGFEVSIWNFRSLERQLCASIWPICGFFCMSPRHAVSPTAPSAPTLRWRPPASASAAWRMCWPFTSQSVAGMG